MKIKKIIEEDKMYNKEVNEYIIKEENNNELKDDEKSKNNVLNYYESDDSKLNVFDDTSISILI